jgi:hypothetical protein
MITQPIPSQHLTTASQKTYRRAIQALKSADVPFLAGGAYALAHYTGITRDTKDFDVFLRPADAPRALDVLANAGYCTEMVFSHWLGKAFLGDDFIDIIFSSGNGIAKVDDVWFEHARPAHFLGEDVFVCPPEETIWSKAYVIERERFDGADINHLIHTLGPELDWQRLLHRFGAHGRVLLAHLVLFGFVYPSDHDAVPDWVMEELIGRLQCELAVEPREPRRRHLCRGTLLSRIQYLSDIALAGYEDARLDPDACMTPEQIRTWTEAGMCAECGSR